MTIAGNEEVSLLLNGVFGNIQEYVEKQNAHIESLYKIGTALSSETHIDLLLEMILREAQEFTNADGGTLYLISKDGKGLQFTCVATKSLSIQMGGSGDKITWPDIPLHKPSGEPNREMVAALCALDNKVINIADVYEAQGYNFEGTKQFDAKTGFRSRSMLVIPMVNHEKEVIGVCQLINRMDPNTGRVIAFTKHDEKSLLSLASQAAVSITNVRLIQDLRELLESFIKTIASAIDAKSPYTGGHVQKVAKIAMLIAEAINGAKEGVYKDIHFDRDALNEIRIAGLMHDVGKITTPEYVMDKSTKLQTIYDRIETIKTRFELYKRELELTLCQKKLELIHTGVSPEELDQLDHELQQKMRILDDDLAFIEFVNFGSEFMGDDKVERIQAIAQRPVRINGSTTTLLTDNERYNLCIRKGTLTEEERTKINEHAHMSNLMLESLPFPKKLRRVPEIAGGHHEKLNGAGYPKGLSADQLSLEARIMALADIFEAITASDRPYKKPNSLSEAMRIINRMVENFELDSNLVRFFFDKKLHVEFARSSLLPEQLDVS